MPYSWFIFMSSILTLLSITNKIVECTFYKAGVVEYYYNIESKLDPKEILYNNVIKYLEIVEKFSQTMNNIEHGILVFPECGLASESNINLTSVRVPEPNKNINNFTGYEVIDSLSKAANKYHTWLVVNLVEKDGDKYYNTDVVFNSNGTIAAKYRKFNLFGEPVDVPSKIEIVSFTTDFNVTFGVFTCFDIMYSHPALDLVAEGINHIIFPTAWYSELPFLTAIQYQKGWSWSNNVSLLAAGLSYSKYGNSGSGIFKGRTGNDLYHQTTNSSESQLLMVVLNNNDEDYFQKLASMKIDVTADSNENEIQKDLPGLNEGSSHKNFEDLRTHREHIRSNKIGLKLKQEPLTAFTTSLITHDRCKIVDDLKPGKVFNCTKDLVKNLCNNNFCCDFSVTATFSVYICKDKSCQEAEAQLPTTTAEDDFSLSMHRLAAFNGVRSFDVTTGGAQTCAVVSCRDETISSCGLTPAPKNPPVCFKYDDKNEACVIRRYITKVKLGGHFSEEDTFVTPNILLRSNSNTSQFGRVTNDFQMKNSDGYYTLVYNALPEDVLGTVAIWSRVFERDGQDVTGRSSSFSLSIVTAIALILIYPLIKILIN